MARATKVNTPVINSAVAWGSAAQKKAQRYFQQLACDQEQEDPSQPRPAPRFYEGEAVAGSAATYGAVDAQGHPIVMSDSEGEAEDLTQVEPEPDMTTAFDGTVWTSIDDQRQLSTGELQATVDVASKVEPEAEEEETESNAESEADFEPQETSDL